MQSNWSFSHINLTISPEQEGKFSQFNEANFTQSVTLENNNTVN